MRACTASVVAPLSRNLLSCALSPAPQEALAKDAADADALVNSIAVAVQTGRAADAAAHLAALREAAPKHAYVRALDTADRAFDRVAAGFGI